MDVNDLWRQHLRYLFGKFALVFEVVEEMKFRDDFEREDTDCVLVQIRRPRARAALAAGVVSGAFMSRGVPPLTEESAACSTSAARRTGGAPGRDARGPAPG